MKPFLITIDTEGDNLWSSPEKITTDNAAFLGRFQNMAEKFNFQPTYLVNYEMVMCKTFQKFGKEIIRDKTGEIGMHLHAWNSPPDYNLSKHKFSKMPYLTDYPDEVMYNKISFLTKRISEIFKTPPLTHRAGRWALNLTYAQMLADLGYQVDSSITPHCRWLRAFGDTGSSAISYLDFPSDSYYIDLKKGIKFQVSNSNLLEVPVTVTTIDSLLIDRIRQHLKDDSFIGKVCNRLFSYPIMLRADGNNLNKLLGIVKKALRESWPYLNFMLHSSELMPGGSKTFPNPASIEKLYVDLEILFSEISNNFCGCTLKTYGEFFAK